MSRLLVKEWAYKHSKKLVARCRCCDYHHNFVGLLDSVKLRNVRMYVMPSVHSLANIT